MKNTITTLMFLFALWQSAAAQTPDSSQLAVFNTGRNITVLSADFGAALTQDLIGEMVMAYDTVMVLKAHTAKDSSGKYPMRYQTERRATKISSHLKGKIAVIDYNKDYDVTQMCMNVQKAGAKALIIIHESNDKRVYKLAKKGIYKDSIRIPIFTIPNKKGGEIQQLLPSMVGIKMPVPPPVQSRVANDNTNTAVLLNKEEVNTEGSTTQSEQTATNADVQNGTGFGKQGFSISPNPTRNQANVHYQFTQPTDVTIEAKTATGQVIFSKILRGATVGNVEMQTVDWANGTYFVTLSRVLGSKTVQTKKLVVRH